MRIISWNINGIRTLPQYYPWNTFKSCKEILEHLEATIICFQELKTSRGSLDKNFGHPGLYNAFFSFPTKKGGYSGVAVYTDSRKAIPLKAEEGLSGILQPKPPLSPDERISMSYPTTGDIELVADEDEKKPLHLTDLDSEGRALVLDFGLFVLINLYCPNEASDERLVFKMNYHLMLQERVRTLIEEGREVIVIGDINICAAPLDHGEGHFASRSSCFYDHPARAWFRRWLEPEGCMIDMVRKFWPERKGMYTCWNTKISARETNYGTRIDYILGTPGLLPWLKHGDIQAHVKGSDHCPVYIDLHDEILLPSGVTLTLREAMKMHGTQREPPRLASQYWDEYSGKQTVLSTFFGKRQNLSSQPSVSSLLPVNETPPAPKSPNPCHPLESEDSLSGPASSESHVSPLPADSPPSPNSPMLSQPTHTKRKFNRTAPFENKSKKQKPNQTKLSTFFTKPSAPESNISQTPSLSDLTTLAPCGPSHPNSEQSQNDIDQLIACQPFVSQESDLSPSQLASSANESKSVWSHLFAPLQPPKCSVHGEPAREFTVTKPGPNKGKTFFVCSRPVGPGYDKGRTERLREEVDPQYKCNFFKWSSEVKRESLKDRVK